MRPVRISFVADSDAWGGAEVWLLHHLRRAERHGVEVSVICAGPVADRFRPWLPAERLVTVPLARHCEEAPATAAALRSQTPDVIHVNLVDPASNAATLTAALATGPTTATLHLAGETGDGAGRQHLSSLYARLALLISTSTAGAVQVETELAQPLGGVVVTCNGVDLPRRPHGPAGHRVPHVGVHGRFTRQKGFDVLISSVRRLVEDGVALQLALGGAGRDEAALRAAAAGLPVTFVGWVEDHRRFLADLDVFCLPSRHDALPLSLCEAMAEGLPCVATDIGDIGSRIGDAVVLVPPDKPEALAEALAALLTDSDRRRQLGTRARSAATERLDADNMVATTYHLLKGAPSLETRRAV